MINGITFDSRSVRAKDDAQVRRKMFDDGVLAGCGMTYSGKTLTIAVGSFLVAGRQIEISIAETIISDTTEASGYGRLRFIIDLTAEPSETVFNQYRWEWDYQAANSGWPALTQEDINGEGDTYEVAMAIVSFASSSISGVVDSLPEIIIEEKLSIPAQFTALPTSGTALTNNAEYRVSANVGTYTFAWPSSPFEVWLKFTTAATFNIAFPGGTTYIGGAPTFAASKTYEMSVKDGVVIVQEVAAS